MTTFLSANLSQSLGQPVDPNLELRTASSGLPVGALIDTRGVTSQWSEATIEDRKLRLRRHGSTKGYHQTSDNAATCILGQQQFKRGADGMAGGGIYFAISPEDTEHKAHNFGPILAADVLLGNVLVCPRGGGIKYSFKQLLSEGYDSVRVPRVNGDELVVYCYDQVQNITNTGLRGAKASPI